MMEQGEGRKHGLRRALFYCLDQPGDEMMASYSKALTIDQLLNDPMTLAVMRADRVDPASLKALLVLTAARLRDADDHPNLPRTDPAFLPRDPLATTRKAV
jgi:hypothetical protein